MLAQAFRPCGNKRKLVLLATIQEASLKEGDEDSTADDSADDDKAEETAAKKSRTDNNLDELFIHTNHPLQ